MSEINTTDKDFAKDVLESDKPVLVDFWAPWCGPCRMLGPIVADVAGETDKARIVKLNVDEAQESAQKYGVSSIPTIIFFKDGKEVERMVGVQTKATLLEKIEELSA